MTVLPEASTNKCSIKRCQGKPVLAPAASFLPSLTQQPQGRRRPSHDRHPPPPPPAPCTQATPTPAAGEPQRSRSTLTPSGLGPDQTLGALQSVFSVSPLPQPATGPFPITGCRWGSDHHSDLQLPLQPREGADVPGIPVSPTPGLSLEGLQLGWTKHKALHHRGWGRGRDEGWALSWAASREVWEPGSRTRGICEMAAATPPRSPPRSHPPRMRRCCPLPGHRPKPVIDRYTF